jgi:hypothetical protein
METLWQTQRRSIACGLLSGVFLVTAVVLSRRISGDASAFSSEAAACATGVAASLIAILATSLPDLVSNRLARCHRTLLISACGIPGVMLGLSVMPAGSSTGLACLLGVYLAAVLTVAALDSEDVATLASNVDQTVAGLPNSCGDTTSVLEDCDHSPERCDESLEPAAVQHIQPAVEERSLDEKLTALADNAENFSGPTETVSPETAALLFEPNRLVPHPGNRPETTQWMSRSQVDGLDVAEGAFRVRFAAGQRLAPVHLPFSPPLADTPEFECEPADDSDLRFRTTAVHAYGIRIEVSRSSDCNEQATVEVAWTASASLKESLAA